MPDKKLIVIGDGSDIEKIKSKASKNVEVLGYQSNEVMQSYMERAKAFVFAAEEDFGITPIEAMASGRRSQRFLRCPYRRAGRVRFHRGSRPA